MQPCIPTIKQLYSELSTEKEINEAEDNLQAYLGVIVRIYQRIVGETELLANLRADLHSLELDCQQQALTAPASSPTM